MSGGPRDRALALAGIFQCCELVRQIAWHGHAETEDFATCIDSIFTQDAPDTPSVYGGAAGVRSGLKLLQGELAGPGPGRNLELTRYAVAILHLERRLMRRPETLDQLAAGIERAQAQREFFDPMHENVIAGLADTYQETISSIGPRIIVHGEQSHLGNPDNAARIRALLLAAIRSAVLWSQSGGSRWRLLLGRKGLLRETQALLAA
jgi:high frequency lysogenization protein